MSQTLREKVQEVIDTPVVTEKELIYNLKKLIYREQDILNPAKESKDIKTLITEKIETIFDEKPNVFYKSGLKDLDRVIGGFMPGEFIIIGGRPSMGKTQLLLNLVRNISQNDACLYLTVDLSETLLSSRFISTISGIPVDKILQHKLNDSEKSVLVNLENSISNYNMMINDCSSVSINAVKRLCEKQISERGVKLVFVDYLQRMTTNRYRNSRDLEISYICKELKSIAKDNNVCVVVNSQLSRGVDLRSGDKRPVLSDLRDSGTIEQDADKVIFIHRPEYYGFLHDVDGNNLEGMVELIIAKNRFGPLGSVFIKRDMNFTGFFDASDLSNFEDSTFKFDQDRLDELDDPF